MKFDTVIIGGGLAGMTCGIRLAEAGQKCAIISQGQSAIHFSSGSFDLLGHLPDGTAVTDPLAAMGELEKTAPGHPYVKIGKDLCGRYALLVPEMLRKAGIPVVGDCRKNHYRITPMGKSKATWLTMDGYFTTEYPDKLPFKKICIVNVEGFLDFYPEFIAEEFRKIGVTCTFGCVNMPDLEHIRKNPSEMRSANIARVFDRESNLDTLATRIVELASDCDAVILPAIIGIGRSDSFEVLKSKVGVPLFLLPTLPPSIPGIKAQQALQRYFRSLGGEYFLGDTVTSGDYENGCVKQIYTENHGSMPFQAKHFVLASGSFFSKGLVASPDRILEPFFGSDTVYVPERTDWYAQRFFDKQRYQSFGVSTNSQLQILVGGSPVANLYCAGAGLPGFYPVQEECGAGVSLLSAFYVADQILK